VLKIFKNGPKNIKNQRFLNFFCQKFKFCPALIYWTGLLIARTKTPAHRADITKVPFQSTPVAKSVQPEINTIFFIIGLDFFLVYLLAHFKGFFFICFDQK